MVMRLESIPPPSVSPALRTLHAPANLSTRPLDPSGAVVTPPIASASFETACSETAEEWEPLTVGEIVRRTLLTSHFVYAVVVSSALARSVREPTSNEPSRLDLRA